MQRNKKSQGIQSTTKFLKSKYIQYKKPTNNKIMLTDLCPQEKAKIGELIKTLEQRKQQNQDLHQQLNSWKSNYMTLDKMKNDLQNLIQNKNLEVKRLSQELDKLQNEKIEKDIELHEVHLQMDKHLQKMKQNELKLSCGINTTPRQTLNQETQTKQKKKKQKQRQVQVNTIEQLGGIEQRQTRKNNFYQPNSKSFDKIMKGQRLIQSDKNNYETAAFKEQEQFDEGQQSLRDNRKQIIKQPKRQSSNIQEFYGNKKLKASELQQNDNRNWSEYDQESHLFNQKYTQEQIQVQDTENDDDEFEILAKKWLQLKEKNIQQLTQGYLINQGEDPSLSINLKSLGVQSKLRNKNQQKVQENEEQQQALNQEQLNRALKSKDFSASRLLNNSRSKKNISQNSDKKSLQNSHSSYKNTSLKNQPKMNNSSHRYQPLHKKNSMIVSEENPLAKHKNFMQHSSRGVDFYSSDLMDLVEEINK